MRSRSDATVFASLLIYSVNRRWEIPSFSSNVRMTVNWSGVIPRCAMRRRNAWFNPYHARRSSSGNLLLSGESIGKSTDSLEFAVRVLGFPSFGFPSGFDIRVSSFK
jgi:hypothetical protein